MTNRGPQTATKQKPKSKEIKKRDNKKCYEKRKIENPDKQREYLLTYYKNKYGYGLVNEMVKSMGVEMTIDTLKKNRKNLKTQAIENPLLRIRITELH